jgi:hypothetical protein
MASSCNIETREVIPHVFRMTPAEIRTQIDAQLTSWPGITTGPGRFGAITFSFMNREVGHIHGTSHADLPLPKPLRNELIGQGRAEPHHVLPQSGWVTVPLKDAEAVLAVFKLNYELIAKKKGVAPGELPEG